MSLFSHRSNATGSNMLLGYAVRTSIFGRVIPFSIGTNRIAPNVIWYADYQQKKVSSGGKSGSKGSTGKGSGPTDYSASFVLAACIGPLAANNPYRVFIDKGVGDPEVWTVGSGTVGQAAWSYLTSKYQSQALGYSEIVWLAAANYDLGSGGTMSNFSFELGMANQFGSGVEDALASDAINIVCTHPYLVGIPAGSMGDLTEIANYSKANGLFISPLIDSQTTGQSVLQELCMVANCEAFESEAKIKFRSYGDMPATSGWGAFTPNLTPVYDLYFDDLIVSKPGDDPILWARDPAEDADNDISIEWLNRGRDYNAETMPRSNPDYIRRFGRNTATAIQAHSIKVARVATQVADIELKKRCYKLSKCKFTVGWRHQLLEQMDIVTVPDQYPSTARLAVRLLSGTEGDAGTMQWEAELLLTGISSPTLHPSQGTGGYVPNTNNNPGSCNPPVFVEATKQMTQGIGYLLLIALSGGPDFGGGSIWTSWDNSHYEYAGRALGTSVTGSLTTDLPYADDPDTTDALGIDLRTSRGSLTSASQQQADAFQSLAVIDDELISYRDAALTGPNQYTLGYLRRGVKGSDISLHRTGAPFALLDGTEFELPYQPSDVGRTLYVKVTAFNQAGQEEQNLSDVPAYSRRLKGPRLPYTLKPQYSYPPAWDSMSTAPTFGTQQAYGNDAAGNPIAGVNLFSYLSPNIPSTAVKQQQLTGYTTSPTGGTMKGGQSFYVAISMVDPGIPSRLSPLSNLLYVTIPAGTNTNVLHLSATTDPGALSAFIYTGPSEDLLGFALSVTPDGPTLDLSFDPTPRRVGPLDQDTSAVLVQTRPIVHGGIAGSPITALTASTMTLGSAGFTTENLAGYDVSLYAKGDKSIVFGPASATVQSSAGNVLTFNISGGGALTDRFAVGDVVVVRSKPGAGTTASKIVDPLWINGGGAGLTPSAEKGNSLVVFGPNLEILADVLIADNDATSISLAAPLPFVPTASTRYIIATKFWTEAITAPYQVAYYDANGQHFAFAQVQNLSAASYLFRLLTVSADGQNSPEGNAQTREIYMYGSPAATGFGSLIGAGY